MKRTTFAAQLNVPATAWPPFWPSSSHDQFSSKLHTTSRRRQRRLRCTPVTFTVYCCYCCCCCLVAAAFTFFFCALIRASKHLFGRQRALFLSFGSKTIKFAATVDTFDVAVVCFLSFYVFLLLPAWWHRNPLLFLLFGSLIFKQIVERVA